MQPRIYWILASAFVILTGCNAASEKEQTPADRSPGNSPYIDDLYLDDQEALEGSGRGAGEVRDDLEASGSGLGPDDEDGDDGGHEFTQHNTIDTTPRKQPEPSVPQIDENIAPKTKQNIPDTVSRTDNAVDSFDSPSDLDEDMDDSHGTEVRVNPKTDDRASSFFAQPGVLAGEIFVFIIHNTYTVF
ncbi:uncharacterized protein LOC117182618 [Belonocnema kinseyi]|uniref:uncharacterized protein LOC117182618 n=1 Tax=Belonocnema kinseyi TaxID=2817044 RepID=UPI00143D4FB3|nr:uncharacterized protein LOC117182618 [Belonocnema kinseyi]